MGGWGAGFRIKTISKTVAEAQTYFVIIASIV